jgi:hypothetical protein
MRSASYGQLMLPFQSLAQASPHPPTCWIIRLSVFSIVSLILFFCDSKFFFLIPIFSPEYFPYYSNSPFSLKGLEFFFVLTIPLMDLNIKQLPLCDSLHHNFISFHGQQRALWPLARLSFRCKTIPAFIFSKGSADFEFLIQMVELMHYLCKVRFAYLLHPWTILRSEWWHTFTYSSGVHCWNEVHFKFPSLDRVGAATLRVAKSGWSGLKSTVWYFEKELTSYLLQAHSIPSLCG